MIKSQLSYFFRQGEVYNRSEILNEIMNTQVSKINDQEEAKAEIQTSCTNAY